jgi:DNA-binding CsgD family transcriptional regulator
LEDDAFLLQVYRAARINAADDFQRTVVSLLRAQFPFVSMMWGNGLLVPDRSAVVPTALHKEGLDDEFLRRWAEEVSGDDPVIPLLVQYPNCAHTIEVAQVYGRYPGLVEFGREFGIESFTLIAGPGLESEQTIWLSLYRQGSVARPTHGQLRWLEAAMPHLTEAWRINAAIHSATQRSNPRCFALAEGATAKLLSSDDDFKIFLISEWGDFDGHVVPRCLAQSWFDRDDIFFEGKNVRFHAKRVTNLVYLSASPMTRECDGLSPRLRQVAGMYVKGLSHKEIAQRIGISPATVRNQIAATYAQLRIHTKIELLERLGDGGG